MATLVVPIESQAELRQHVRAARTRESGFAGLWITLLTCFAFAVHGYHPFAEDGGLYLAGIENLIDPELFSRGAAFVAAPMRFSAFAPAVAGIVRLFPGGPEWRLHTVLPVVLLALHLATIWATLFAAWMLSARCWPGRAARAGAVALLACWLGLPVAGTALLFMDPYLTARSIATPCMVLALVAALDFTSNQLRAGRRWRGFALWLVSIALAFAVHPLMAGYAFAATVMLSCVRSERRSVRGWGMAALAGGSLALAGLLQHIAQPQSAGYLRIAATRTYWFPAEWRWYEWIGAVAPLAILAAAGWGDWRLSSQRRTARIPEAKIALARMAVLAGVTSCIVAAIYAHAAGVTYLVASAQPLRIFQIVYLVMILVLGGALGESLLRDRRWRWCAALLLLGGVMFGAERATFPHSRHWEIPAKVERNPWVESFLWIRDNTPKNAFFALDADYINAPGEDAQCFRAIAERSALADYSKDGGEASIAPELTPAWMSGQAAQSGLSAPATTDRERVAKLRPLGVDWVVLQRGATTSLECPYRNSTLEVCRIPSASRTGTGYDRLK